VPLEIRREHARRRQRPPTRLEVGMATRRLLTRGLVLTLWSAAASAQQPPPAPPQQPVFRGGVDMVRVDVQVVASNGEPIVDLTAADFQVAIDGRPRRVVSAELVRFPPPDPVAPAAAPIRTPGYVNADARVFVLAVDQMGFTTAGIGPLRPALRRFVEQLRPADLVGVYSFPFRGGGLALRHDHRAILPAVEQLVGLRESRLGIFSMTPSEIVEITSNDPDTLARVVSRECEGSGDPSCAGAVRADANAVGSYLESEAAHRIGALRELAAALASIPGRKTVVLVSGSMISGPATRGRPDVSGLLQRLGEEISTAEISLYTLHWDTSFADAFSASHPASRRPQDRMLSLGADRQALGAGLELLTGKAGGALLRVEAGTGDDAFSRVLRETSAHYLLGVEPAPDDRDGKPHVLRVTVARRGATVRGRTHVLIPSAGTNPPPPLCADGSGSSLLGISR
jgi:VWFA-related protein